MDLFGRSAYWAEGMEMWRGYKLFFDMYHEKFGGVLINGSRMPVELILIDDESSEDLVEKITRYIIDTKGIRLLLSPYGDALAFRAAQVAGSRAVLVSPTTATAVKMVGQPHFFSMTPSSDRTFNSALEALVDAGARTISVLHEDSLGMSQLCSMKSTASRYGLSLMSTRVVPSSPSRADLEGAVHQLKDDNSDAVFVCVIRETCHQVADLIREANWDAKALVFKGCVTEVGLHGFARWGNLGVSLFVPSLSVRSALGGWHVKDLIGAYMSAYGTEDPPSENTVKAFAACEALVGAIEAAGATEPALVAEALRTMDVTSINGRIAFDVNNQLDRDYLLVQGRTGGQTSIVAPPAVAESAIHYPRPTWLQIRCQTSKPEFDSYGFTLEADGALGSCRPCEADRVSQLVPKGPDDAGMHRVCMRCSQGQFVNTPIGEKHARCSECGVGRYWTQNGFEGQNSGGSCEKCPKGTFQNMSGQTQCELCPLGQFSGRAEGATMCTPCQIQEGSQSFSDKYGQMLCLPCPKMAICQSQVITNQARFAILARETPPGSGVLKYRAVPCIHEAGDACLSHGRCAIDDTTGEPAMEGPLCGSCRPGHGRLGRLRICKVCDDVWTSWIYALGDVAIAFGSMTCICAVVLNTDFSTLQSISPVVLKLFSSYVYFLTALRPLIPPDALLHRLLDFTDALCGSLGTYDGHWGRSCLWQRIFPNIKAHQIAIISGMCPLPAVIVSTALFFRFLRFAQRKRGVEVTPWARCVSVCAVYVYILQPQSAILLLDAVHCVHFDKSRLAMDTKVACFEGDHSHWSWLALAGLLFYTVGVPGCVALVLHRYHRQNRLGDLEVKKMFGFLYNGYAPRAYNYECICMFRKAFIHILSVAPGLATEQPPRSQAIRSLCMLAGCSLFIVLHHLFDPYDKRGYFMLEKIEFSSLAALFSSSFRHGWEFMTLNLFVSRFAKDFLHVVIMLFVVSLHARFFCMAFWACARVCLSCPSTIKKRGRVEVHEECYVLSGLDESARRLFQNMVALILDAHIEGGTPITYDGLVAAMQRIVVHAGYLKALRAQKGNSAAEYVVEVLCKCIEAVPLSDNQKDSAKSHLREVILAFVDRAYALSNLVRVQENEDQPEEQQGGASWSRFGARNADDFRRFTYEALAKSAGSCYTVDELYIAMLSLGKDVCGLASPPMPSSHQDQVSITWNSTMTTGKLETQQVLHSELRAAMREHRDLMEQLCAEKHANVEPNLADGEGSPEADHKRAVTALSEFSLVTSFCSSSRSAKQEDEEDENNDVLSEAGSSKAAHLSALRSGDVPYWGCPAVPVDRDMLGVEVPRCSDFVISAAASSGADPASGAAGATRALGTAAPQPAAPEEPEPRAAQVEVAAPRAPATPVATATPAAPAAPATEAQPKADSPVAANLPNSKPLMTDEILLHQFSVACTPARPIFIPPPLAVNHSVRLGIQDPMQLTTTPASTFNAMVITHQQEES